MSELTAEQIKLLEQNKIIPVGCPTEQINFFNEVCKRKRLDPFTRQIHLVERKSKDGNNWIKSYTIQAGIDGMRAIAQRNAKIVLYKRWVEKREDDIYGICEIVTEDRGTYRDELPFNEYKQTKFDGGLNSFWAKFPQTMIKKCAEESVLRMMVPEDLSGVYGDDEMMQADSESKETKSLKEPEINEKPTRNYADETKDIRTKEEFESWYATLTEDDKKPAYNIIESIKYRLTVENIEQVISKITVKSNDKSFFTIDKIISETKDIEKKDHLINIYNEMLEKKGFEHRYVKTPFED